MPELPEVQTIREQLTTYLPLTIANVSTSKNIGSLEKTLNYKYKDLIGLELSKILRKGKFLLFLTNKESHSFISHLGMSGTWRISTLPIQEKHAHLNFTCENLDGENFYLSYVDPRRFGHLYLMSKSDCEKRFDLLGADLCSKEMNEDYIYESLKRYPNRHLKQTLLDQALFAGSGNYIASEVCARAGIRPTRRCGKVTKREIPLLKKAIDLVLDQSLKTGGTTFSGGYQDTKGDKGEGVQNLVVFYQKTCQMCLKTEVKKIFINKRGTYYCPSCQK